MTCEALQAAPRSPEILLFLFNDELIWQLLPGELAIVLENGVFRAADELLYVRQLCADAPAFEDRQPGGCQCAKVAWAPTATSWVAG